MPSFRSNAAGTLRPPGTNKTSPTTVIVPCGGDGTIQDVINGVAPLRPSLSPKDPAIGLAPAGRCNDFARIFGIRKNAQEVAETLLRGQRMPVDLGKVNDRFFCTVATVGVDADISEYVDTQRLPIRGTLAYVWGALRILSTYAGRAVRITGDGIDYEGRVFLASSANTSSYGGSIKIVPHADATDAQLDLCQIDHMTRLRSLYLLAKVLFGGRHITMPEVHFERMSSIHIDGKEVLSIWADGECMGSTPADIRIAPKAIDIIVPAALTQGNTKRVRGKWS
ncbi:MAG: diacylglycerol/lipid kinase family protein [Phycisphaerae bacterium]